MPPTRNTSPGAGAGNDDHTVARIDALGGVDTTTTLDEPATGTVRFGGVDLADVDRAAWWELIGDVPQRPLVLNATVAENVRLGRADATDDEVAGACRVAGADAFVRRLADGNATEVVSG